MKNYSYILNRFIQNHFVSSGVNSILFRYKPIIFDKALCLLLTIAPLRFTPITQLHHLESDRDRKRSASDGETEDICNFGVYRPLQICTLRPGGNIAVWTILYWCSIFENDLVFKCWISINWIIVFFDSWNNNIKWFKWIC